MLNISGKKVLSKTAPFSNTVREARIKFAGHGWKNRKSPQIHYFGHLRMDAPVSIGHPMTTYIDQLFDDTRCLPENLPDAMDDRNGWKVKGKNIRANITS